MGEFHSNEFSRLEEIAFSKGYRVVDGEVYSPYNNSTKKLYLHSKNKPYVCFCVKVGKRTRNVLVHRMVAYQKYGDAIYNDGICVRHMDGDGANNLEDNIEIGTHSDNMSDIDPSLRLKKSLIGTSKQRKFTDEQIVEIKNKYSSGWTLKMLMEEYGGAKSTMSYIVNNKTYQHKNAGVE